MSRPRGKGRPVTQWTDTSPIGDFNKAWEDSCRLGSIAYAKRWRALCLKMAGDA